MALKPTQDPEEPIKYQVAREFDVKSGVAAPWFGQPGGGTQYKLSQSVQWLLDQGFLTKVE